jgi:hypothetical protein
MMESSLHLVGMTVPCHVCTEPLVVPPQSSSESGSFVIARRAAVKPPAASLLDEEEEPGGARAQTDAASPTAVGPIWWIVGAVVALMVVVGITAVLWLAKG